MGIYRTKLKQMLKSTGFSELMPVIEYSEEDKLFICDGPAIGCMLICTPSAGSNDEIRNSLSNLYKLDFPAGTSIQASLVSTPDIENSLFGYNAIRGGRMLNSDQEQCEALANTIHNFYRKGTREPINESGFRFRSMEFWFTVKVPIKAAVPTDKECDAFNELIRQVMSMLTAFGPSRANEFDYKRRMNVLLNMYDKDGWRNKAHHEDKEQRSLPIRELLLNPGKRVEVKTSGLSIKDGNDEESQFIKSMSITEMPEHLIYGQMLNLVGDWELGHTGLYEPFMLTLNIVYPDQITERKALNKNRAFITNQARGAIIQYLDKLRFQKRDYDMINRELDQEGSKLIQYSMQIVIFSETEKKAADFSEVIKGYYSRLNVKLVHDSHFTLPFVLGALPFGMDEVYVEYSKRFNKGTSKAAVFLTPHMGSWTGNTAYPAFMLASRFGQVVNIDFFNSPTNYNIYCAATSGSGKSFFTGYLVNSMLGSGIHKHANPYKSDVNPNDGAQVFIIDVGRSYEGLAAQYEHSKFLVFGKEFKYSMNPFPSITEFDGKEGQANMLRAIIKTMASPSGDISDLQNAEILAVLTTVWRDKGNQGTITDVANECLNHPDDEMKRIGKQLRPFCEGGIYGDFFGNKYPPVDYNSRLIVCELEELKSDIHLQVVVLMSVMVAIQHAMYLTGSDRRKMLIIDEGWEYLKEDGNKASMMQFFAEFLETAWRRLRKTNGSGALVTQSVMDGYGSAAGRAIINNSAWLLLMKQNLEAVDRLESEKMYAGSKSDFSLIRSLRTVKPNPGITEEAFSEVFVRYEGQKQVCRLYTDRKLQLILTTNPDEKAIRKSYMDRGMTLVEATEAMYRDELEAANRKAG
jgi:conjugal transfer ATP-binding protein TraC